MFTVTVETDALESVELRDHVADSSFRLAPARGGLGTRLSMHGRDIFYLDESTLRDAGKNVRGGNPVLFPQPGKLDGDRFRRGAAEGALKQHGFARNLRWELLSTDDTHAARATLALHASPETMRVYPWDFALRFEYILRGHVLRIEQHISNHGAETMPFGTGFHPYFQVPQHDKAMARIGTRATRAFDNVTKTTGTLGAIDLTQAEVDLHLVDHGNVPMTLEWPAGSIEVRGSEEYTHWVIWTVRDKDYVCIEPWTCPGDALNTGERLIELAGGESRTLWVEYEIRR